MNHVLRGDCEQVLINRVPSQSVDLIITSPPYANKRSWRGLGRLRPEEYVEWFLPKAREFQRVLKPTGSFILNIKEHVVDGQRHTYVLDLIKGLKEQGWRWVETYPWCKTTVWPGVWGRRFRDAWEPCYHFTKEKEFVFNRQAVMVQPKQNTKDWMARLSKGDTTLRVSSNGSGFSTKRSPFVGGNWSIQRTFCICHLKQKIAITRLSFLKP
jgi:site-specific DNA-methyltransferase (adenine-specific)